MATRTGKGGYDYDFVTAPPKSLECPVCLMTFRDPHVISCCGNEFCQLCIERVQRDGKPCPLCNEPNFTTMLHKKLVREVNGLVIRCPQKELGCEWEGELGQVEQHLNPGGGLSSSSGCGYVIVECSFQCGAHLQRRMVGEHEMESCPKRPIEMQVASLMQKFEVLTLENKMLKQELTEVKQTSQKQQEELIEVKEKNIYLLEAHESMQKAYGDLQKKQNAIAVKIDEETARQKRELIEMKEANEQMKQKLQEELNEVKRQNKHIHKANEDVHMVFDELKKKQDAMELDFGVQCASLQTHTTALPVPPFYFTIMNVYEYLKNNLFYYRSDPFYSHPGGYKMAVTICLNSSGVYKGTHLFLGVGIQRGEFDDRLQWPFKGKVTVQAYNRTTKKWSNQKTLVLSKEECGMDLVRRCVDVQTCGSRGYNDFLSLSELQDNYITKDGRITTFRVTKVVLL